MSERFQSRGFRLGSIAGIPIDLDPSWFLIAVLITLALRGNFGLQVEGASGTGLWIAATGTALAFLGSVLVHELSHSVVATRRGIQVRRIRLFVFGGVSEIRQEATSARDEFAIAVVGPVSSIILGGLFFATALLVEGSSLASAAMRWLATINLVLGVFNLMPGLPLDGGRVLKSVIWRVSGNLRRAVHVSVSVGKVLAFALIGSGLLLFPYLGFAALWNVFIGWYLYQGALVARVQADVRAVPLSLTAADVMQPQAEYVSPAVAVGRFLDEFGDQSDDVWVPVIDAWGVPRGVVRVGAAQAAATDGEASTLVGEIMQTVELADIIPASTPIRTVLGKVRRADQVFLLMKGENPAGILTALDLERWLSAAR